MSLGLQIWGGLIQGITYWNIFYELSLKDRNRQAKICLKVKVKFWGLDILVSSTSFWKSNIGWPQQPPIEEVQISVKIWIFDDLFHKNKDHYWSFACQGLLIQISGAVICLMKWGCKGHWGHGGCWGCRGHWSWRGSKAWKITTED